jgi:hypothetical protein
MHPPRVQRTRPHHSELSHHHLTWRVRVLWSCFAVVLCARVQVYRGRRRGQPVAVKVLSLHKDTSEAVAREIALMRKCTCPHIVAYIDAYHASLDGRLTLHLVKGMAWIGPSPFPSLPSHLI